VLEVLKPGLDQGKLVISDRYVDSTLPTRAEAWFFHGPSEQMNEPRRGIESGPHRAFRRADKTGFCGGQKLLRAKRPDGKGTLFFPRKNP